MTPVEPKTNTPSGTAGFRLTPIEPIYKQIGRNLKKLRDAKMGQEDLADQVGISFTYISHIEHGKSRVAIHVLEKMARALGCKIADLIGE